MALRDRISQQQLDDLFHRRITVKDLAAALNCNPKYLSRTFPDKVPALGKTHKAEKQRLIAARADYRDSLAEQIDRGRLTVRAASLTACCSERTMWRHVANVRGKKVTSG